MADAKQIESYVVPALKVAGGLALLFAGYKVMQKLGLIKTGEESEAEKTTETATKELTQSSNTAVVEKEDPTKNAILSFNPNYRLALVKAYAKAYPNKDPKTVFTVSKQLGANYSKFPELAKDLYAAHSIMGDDEEKVYNVFRLLQTQYQLSFLASVYSTAYKTDLFEYLNSFLSPTQFAKVIDIVKGYNQYIK